jgi:hypothetical protein
MHAIIESSSDDVPLFPVPTNVADTARLFKKHLRSLSSLSFLDNVTDGMMEEEGNLQTD